MQFIYIIWLAFGIFVKIWIFIAIGLIKLVFQLVDYLRSLFLRLASLHYFAFGNRIYKFLFTKKLETHEIVHCRTAAGAVARGRWAIYES